MWERSGTRNRNFRLKNFVREIKDETRIDKN